MWFRQLENGSIGTWVEFVDRFTRQFQVHVMRFKSVISLATQKQRAVESLGVS